MKVLVQNSLKNIRFSSVSPYKKILKKPTLKRMEVFKISSIIATMALAKHSLKKICFKSVSPYKKCIKNLRKYLVGPCKKLKKFVLVKYL